MAQTSPQTQIQDSLERAAAPEEVAQNAALRQAVELTQQAIQLYQQGRYSEAEPLFQAALAISREQLGDRHPNVATSLNNLALLYTTQGRYDEAEVLYQDSLAIRREQLGDRHLDVANSLNNLASLYQDQGRYGEAESLYQDSIIITQGQLGDRHPEVAANLNNLASLYQDQGRYGEAETLYQDALSIWREQLGDRHPNVATSLNNLALLYDAQGRYSEAEPLYQDALAIRREQLGDRHPDIATSLNNLALLYQNQGRYGEAEPLFQTAFTIWRERLGNRHPLVADSLYNLAELYRLQGRYGEAEPLFKESLAIRREQLGDGHADVANSLNNLALLYHDQKRYGEAEILYQDALIISREQLGDRHPDVATSLSNLAELYYDQGRYDEAEPLFQESLTIRRERLSDRHPLIASSLNNLSGLYGAQGETIQAIRFFREGLAIEEWNLEINLATLTDAQRQIYIAPLAGTTNAAISFSLQAPEAQSLGLTTLLRRKGRLLDAGSNSLQRLRQNLTLEDQVVLDEFVTVRQQLATLTFNPPANVSSQQYRQQLAQLEAEANDLEKTLAQRSAFFRVEAQPVEIEAVQAQIPTNGVLVEYVRYQPFNVTHSPNPWGNRRYAAYLLFPDGRIEVVDLGDADEIDTAVQSFTRLLQTSGADLQRTSAAPQIRPRVVERITENIQSLVFDPLAPYLQDVDHLLISPDGQLNRLPFEALQPEVGGDYLVQRYQISYLSSGRDLLKLNLVAPSPQPAVILANPDYESTPETVSDSPLSNLGEGPGERAIEISERSTDLSQIQVGPLPGTAAEAETIRPLLPNATILTETDATENALKQVQAPRILHIATHGFFLQDVERPDLNSRNIGTDGTDGFLPQPVGIPIENPLLRSGLALAGFNTRSSGNEDGVLTALEAANLNLFGTQLVVLSACETGLGDIANGEGVYGLRRAFALAGAETQLMSLWQVSDFGTQSLMARYYEKLTAGMGRSEALQEVQLEMIEEGGQYSRPFYWAAFILAGDWRSL
ncbi:MAG: CHAT domain-containing tetratricopeptide repeat protein [Cyanobacteria bacterium P01_D01_bin.115]